jgi:hypothetical protein
MSEHGQWADSREQVWGESTTGEDFESRKAEAREAFGDWTIVALATELKRLQGEKEDAESVVSALNAKIDVIRIELLPAKMDDMGVKSMNIEGLGRLGLTGDMYVRTLNKPGLFDWLRSNSLEDVIQDTVNASTLKASLKNRVKKGLDLPPDSVVKITPFTRASVTKA